MGANLLQSQRIQYSNGALQTTPQHRVDTSKRGHSPGRVQSHVQQDGATGSLADHIHSLKPLTHCSLALCHCMQLHSLVAQISGLGQRDRCGRRKHGKGDHRAVGERCVCTIQLGAVCDAEYGVC